MGNRHPESWYEPGKKYGRLEIIKEVPKDNRKVAGKRELTCKCDCGNIVNVNAVRMFSGMTKSCGCLRIESRHKRGANDLLGKRFGRLVVLSEAPRSEWRKHREYYCKCDCGTKLNVKRAQLTTGHTQSCGCLKKDYYANTPKKNHIGEKYGRLTIIDELPKQELKNNKYRVMVCQCDCGNIVNVRLGNLRSGNSLSCGCLELELIHQRRKNLIGERFGRLVVEKELEPKRKNVRSFKCKCDCGNETIVQMSDLLHKMTRSCGCLRKEATRERNEIDLTGQTFWELTAIKRIDNLFNSNGKQINKWLFRCSCGREIAAYPQNVKRGMSKSCGHMGRSAAEYEINKFLKEHNVIYDYEATFDDLRNSKTNRKYMFDFKIFRSDGSFFLIEHQGLQHFYENKHRPEFGKQQREVTDKIKKDYCKLHGITLYETLYNEDYITKLEQILKNELEKDGDVYESEVSNG